MDTKNRKLMKNSALLVIGNFASKVMVFLLVPFYTSVLSTAEYGISDLITTTVNLLYPVFTLMISTAVLRFCLDGQEKEANVLLDGLIIEVVGFLLLLPIMLLFTHFSQSLRPYGLYLIIYYFVYSLNALLLQYTKGNDRVFPYALAGVNNTIGMVASNLVLLLFFRRGVYGYLIALIIGLLCSIATLLVADHKQYKKIFQSEFDFSLMKDMLRYAVPMIGNNLSWWINNSSDRYIMAIFCTGAELGIYSVSYKIPSLISVFTTIFISAWEISSVDAFGTEENRRYFSKIYNLYAFFNVCMASVIMMVVRIVAGIAFQKDFFGAWQFALFLLIGQVFQTQGAFLGTVFMAAKQSSTIMQTTLIGAAINTALNFALIPRYGAQGAAIATMCGYFIVWLIRLKKSREIMILDINLRRDGLAYVMLLVVASAMLSNCRSGTLIAFAANTGLFVLFRKDVCQIVKKVLLFRTDEK